MSRAKGLTVFALAASLAAAAAGCKATDHAEEQGRARSAAQSNAPRARTNANAQAQLTPPAKPVAPPESDPHDHGTPLPEVRRVGIEEAREAVERGEAVFVDVRGEDAFREGHIPGAIMISANDMTKRAAELPAGKQIITYCA